MSDQSPETVCNLALDWLGADPITTIAAPTKPNEKLLARLFPRIRDGELRTHRWLCAMRVDRLTPTGTPISNGVDGTLYRYNVPPDYLGAVRTSGSTWVVRGRQLLDPSSTYIDVKIKIRNEPVEWDPCLHNAVAALLAEAACEKITRSTDKKADMTAEYKKWIDKAKHTNALELGAEDVVGADDNYSWLTARNI